MILEKDGDYYTPNLVPGVSVYGEKLIIENGREYRFWNPHRSKLAAYLKEGGSLSIDNSSTILYLGAGDGTTVSHVSDLLTNGRIFAVEISSKPFRNLLSLSEKRDNVFPILGDARNPVEYQNLVRDLDFLYQDIAQQDQVNIFIKNLLHFRPPYAGMAIKARSIDVTRSPSSIFQEVKSCFEQRCLNVLKTVDISPWQKDHAIVLIKFESD